MVKVYPFSLSTQQGSTDSKKSKESSMSVITQKTCCGSQTLGYFVDKVRNKFKTPVNKWENNYRAKSLCTDDEIFLGNNATIEGHVETSNDFIAKNNFKADSLTAGSVCLENLANISGEVISKSYCKTGNDFKADSLKSCSVDIGSDAEIKGAVKAAIWLQAKDGFKAGSVFANNVGIGNNADIKGKARARFIFKAGNNFKANSVIGSKVFLGSIDRLNEIHLNEFKKVYQNAVLSIVPLEEVQLILNSEDIKPKKIKVFTGDRDYIYIQTPTGNKDILKKLEFINNTGKKVKVKVTKITD